MRARLPVSLPALFALSIAAGASAASTPDPSPRLDPSKTTAFTGKVVRVESAPGTGATLVLDAGKQEQQLHLGPPDILDRLGFSLKEGEAVSGEAFTALCRTGDLAVRSLEKTASHEQLTLRDEAGVPVWRAAPGAPRRESRAGCRSGRGEGRGYGRCGAQEDRGGCRQACGRDRGRRCGEDRGGWNDSCRRGRRTDCTRPCA